LPLGWGPREYGEAFAAAVEDRNRLARGERTATPVRTRSGPIVGDWLDECLQMIREPIEAGDPSAYSPATLESYTAIGRLIKKHELATKHLTAVTTGDVDNLRLGLLAKGYSEGYTKQVVWTLAKWVNVARVKIPELGIERNPARVPRSESYGRRERGGRDEGPTKFRPEVTRELLVREGDSQLGRMIRFAATTGMRQRELAGAEVQYLRVSDARFDVAWQLMKGELRRPKYESERPVPLVSSLAQLWAPLDGGSGFLFIDPDTGLPFREHKLTKLLNDAWSAIEPRPNRHSWHVFRHTFSTLLDRAGVRPLVIDYVMGHKPRGISEVYRHVRPEDLDVVLEVIEAAYPVTSPPSVQPVPASGVSS
jgi:integrase